MISRFRFLMALAAVAAVFGAANPALADTEIVLGNWEPGTQSTGTRFISDVETVVTTWDNWYHFGGDPLPPFLGGDQLSITTAAGEQTLGSGGLKIKRLGGYEAIVFDVDQATYEQFLQAKEIKLDFIWKAANYPAGATPPWGANMALIVNTNVDPSFTVDDDHYWGSKPTADTSFDYQVLLPAYEPGIYNPQEPTAGGFPEPNVRTLTWDLTQNFVGEIDPSGNNPTYSNVNLPSVQWLDYMDELRAAHDIADPEYANFIIALNADYANFVSGDGPTWILDNFRLVLDDSPPEGDADFNDDGDVNADDIDILWAIVRNTGTDPNGNDTADLNGDSFANENDVDFMLANLLDAGTNRLYGDADLDGGVGGLDFTAWRLRAGTGWANGDFDGDGGIGGLDFTLWRTRPSVYPSDVGPHSGLAAVPEPGTLVLLGLGLPALALVTRRRKGSV